MSVCEKKMNIKELFKQYKESNYPQSIKKQLMTVYKNASVIITKKLCDSYNYAYSEEKINELATIGLSDAIDMFDISKGEDYFKTLLISNIKGSIISEKIGNLSWNR